MELKSRVDAFRKLGQFLSDFRENTKHDNADLIIFSGIVQHDHTFNPWFTESNIRLALHSIENSLQESKIIDWVSRYPLINNKKNPLRIGVVTAGNLPLVGFQDFISVLISGNIFIGKLSSKDNRLLKFIAEFLFKINPDFKNYIFFEENALTEFDAIIATGSNNTSRYFEYYFGKYPHIIRQNRSSLAVLTGNETNDQLTLLADDIFQYFGLGCRNVSKLFVPVIYNFERLFKNINHYHFLYQHNKYANNYDYNRSIYLMNKIPHLDNGFVILKEDFQISSPIGVVYYEFYKDLKTVETYINSNQHQIQCVVSDINVIKGSIPFGKAQQPELWDYADNIDILDFLLNL